MQPPQNLTASPSAATNGRTPDDAAHRESTPAKREECSPVAENSDQTKTWKAGTLTYTSASLAGLFALLLIGDFAWAMRDRSVGPMAQWYITHLSVSNLVYGLLMTSLPSVISLILGPVISVSSDRHRGKRGRRIPFLLATTPFAATGMIGLAFTPLISKFVHSQIPGQNEIVIAIISFGFFWTIFEFATIASQAVFGGLINDVVPQQLIGRFYGLFRAVSLVDGMIFNFWLMAKVPTHYTIILTSLGLFYGAAFLTICLNLKEGDYPPPPSPPTRTRTPITSFLNEARSYFRECFKNPYYLSIFVMSTAAALTFFPVNTFSIPFAKSLGVDMNVYGKWMAFTYAISFCLSYFLGWLCDTFHPLRMCIGCMSAYLFISVFGSIFAHDAPSFIFAWVLHGVISGCYFTCSASLGQRLFPRSRFAQFGSAAGIVASVSGMIVGPTAGIFIDATGNNYRYTFAMAAIFATIALIGASCVFVQFLRLGGPKNYVAPE